MISDPANFLHSLGWAALNSFWQMAVLWICYQLLISFFKLKSSHKSYISSTFLIIGFSWFIYTFIISISSSTNSITFLSGFLNINGNQQFNNWLLQAIQVVSVIYLSLFIFPILRLIKNYRYVHIIRQNGLSRININSNLFVTKTASILGIKRKVRVWISELVSSPVTIDFLKPIILVPLAAINQLSPKQLEAVLIHELAHIKRYDYLINLFINFIQTILYFNPFVKAFINIIEIEREKSCDELVIQFQYDSHDYASALLALEKANHSQTLLALSITGNKNDLLTRIENILRIPQKRKLNIRKITRLAFSLCLVILINILFLFSQHISTYGNALNNKIVNISEQFISGKKIKLNKATAFKSSPIINLPIVVDSEIPTPLVENNFSKNLVSTILPSELVNVSFNNSTAINLNSIQEDQIQVVLDASKKVLEANQWKTIENNIADVLTQNEKDEIKVSYLKGIESFDWSQWESRLRTSYENINWDNVNTQLNKAVTQIKLDSLQRFYSNIAVQLKQIQNELNLREIKNIPDTNISAESIFEKRELVQKLLNEIKAIRNKKVVHL